MKHNTKRPLSLTLRVVLSVVVTIAVSLLVVRQLLIGSIEHHFIEQDADELGVIVHSVQQVFLKEPTDPKTLAQSLSQAVAGHHGVYYQINNSQQQIIYNNANFDLSQLTDADKSIDTFKVENIQHWQYQDKAYRGIALNIATANDNYRLIAAIDMDFHIHFLQQLGQSLWIILLGSCLLILLAAWVAVHQGLAPLRGLSDNMRDIQTSKLDIRLNTNEVPSELAHMVQSFNHMLNRLEDGFTKLSHFSADIAHEIRTPLTNIITQTQVSLSRPRTAEEYQNVLFSNLEEQERLSKMVSDMLWLAKSKNGLITPNKQPLNIADEISAIFEFFEALAEEAGVKLAFSGQPSVINADRSLLRHALTNLLSNAIRHTASGHSIVVNSYQHAANTLCISVENPGPAISAEHLPYLFERFYRADQSRQRHSDGAGLGLAITKAIIEAHDGDISVTSDKNLTRFVITLRMT